MKRTIFALFTLISCSQPGNLHSQMLQKPLVKKNSGLSCRRLPQLMTYIMSKHVTEREFNKEIKERIKKQYVKWLDGSKTLLLKSDVKTVNEKLDSMFKTMNKGDCQSLQEIKEIVVKRAKENERFIAKFLGKNYKFQSNIEFISDSDKREYFKTEAEKNAFLEKFAHFQFANYLLADTKEKEAKELLKKRYTRITKRFVEKEEGDIMADFIKAFASALDPHSSYFSPQDFEDFNVEMNLALEGIGASLSSKDGFTIVEELIKGGAAERGKELAQKDKIIAVAQDKQDPVNVIDMDLKNVVRLIRGKKGTKVNLTVLRKEKGETSQHKITIVRDKIDLADQAASIKYETRELKGKKIQLGIIDFPSFYGTADDNDLSKRSSFRDVKKLVAEASQKKVDGLLINLAQNGGGVLEGARKISGLFIEQGPIVATKDARDRVSLLVDDEKSVLYSGPLVLLTSRLSASAAEIMAGALKDYDRALIVGGDHTFGKGTVQQVEPLPYELGAVKTTTALFFIPGGESTQHQGVNSHISFPSIYHTDEIGEKSFDYSLKATKIKKFKTSKTNTSKSWKPLNKKIIKQLSSKSKRRIAQSEDFKEIEKDIKEANKDKGIIKLADFMSKAKDKKKDEDKDKDKSFKERRDDLQKPYINEALNVLADLVMLQGS